MNFIGKIMDGRNVKGVKDGLEGEDSRMKTQKHLAECYKTEN
jgi:hypothetical protein